ncbi:LysE family translocator [Erythrobacter sp.]|uniref:LysE family translocator n=1 Tax=Erythrobacter sp. TaxID=1042 RepID=UPI001B1A547F|nr:LysE family translocator [Erythrobacter sp.]MBO6526648.1 LysE family translocator [Erythrobacter sp.]MBO6529142.1 LysE family translocator [Erythrobacter sp.]
MSAEVWAAFLLFAVVAVATPGPNNLLLLNAGLRQGLRKTLPFVIGINIGFSMLMLAIGFGLGRLFEQSLAIQMVLKILGTAYFLFLAFRLFRPAEAREQEEKPWRLGFWSGIAIQAVNPKAWVMCITTISLFLPRDWDIGTLGSMVGAFVVLGAPANIAWAGLGRSLRSILSDAKRLRLFNMSMAALLILSIAPVWIPRF